MGHTDLPWMMPWTRWLNYLNFLRSPHIPLDITFLFPLPEANHGGFNIKMSESTLNVRKQNNRAKGIKRLKKYVISQHRVYFSLGFLSKDK